METWNLWEYPVMCNPTLCVRKSKACARTCRPMSRPLWQYFHSQRPWVMLTEHLGDSGQRREEWDMTINGWSPWDLGEFQFIISLNISLSINFPHSCRGSIHFAGKYYPRGSFAEIRLPLDIHLSQMTAMMWIKSSFLATGTMTLIVSFKCI